jgi:hypothetical protein
VPQLPTCYWNRSYAHTQEATTMPVYSTDPSLINLTAVTHDAERTAMLLSGHLSPTG